MLIYLRSEIYAYLVLIIFTIACSNPKEKIYHPAKHNIDNSLHLDTLKINNAKIVHALDSYIQRIQSEDSTRKVFELVVEENTSKFIFRLSTILFNSHISDYPPLKTYYYKRNYIVVYGGLEEFTFVDKNYIYAVKQSIGPHLFDEINSLYHYPVWRVILEGDDSIKIIENANFSSRRVRIEKVKFR